MTKYRKGITYGTAKRRERAQRNEETPRQRRIMQRLIRAGGDRDPPVSLWQITLEVERMMNEAIDAILFAKKRIKRKRKPK